MRTPIWCRGQASRAGDACREVIDQLLEVNARYTVKGILVAGTETDPEPETGAPKLPAAQIRGLAALRRLHSGGAAILFGPVGVGKTHAARALGHQAARQGANVRFARTSRILAELVGGHADRTWDKRIRELIRPDLLILDDFSPSDKAGP